MKKLAMFSANVLIFILLVTVVSGDKKKIAAGIEQSPADIISCALPAPAPLITAEEFREKYIPPAVMIRKNIYSLSAAEITSIKTGITNMKALPHTNKTSWLYQAAIHGTTLPDNLPSWNTCHQPGQSFFFLAWHRMYVYFFERILRAKSGNPNLTLPYWNYQTNAVLHPDYRNSASSNPLYDGTRSSSINSGGSLPASIMTSIVNALNQVPYYDFQTSINGPHGSVHTTINGNMSSVSSAAKDPVFWLHHCNVDRLWEEWLRKCGGRANPTDNPWLTKTYTFFDENGTAVNMSGSQVVNTSTQLNYRYDFPLSLPCNFFYKWFIVKEWVLIRRPLPFNLGAQPFRASFAKEKTEELESFIRTTKKTKFDFQNKITPDKLLLTVGGIKIDKIPEGVVEVYLNLPANETPTHRSKHFVGLLDLFSAEHHSKHKMAGMKEMDEIELDASKVTQVLGLTPADLKKAEVSFVVRGNTLQGREVKTEAKITVQNINFSLHQMRREQ